jgi:hypothetical protein
MKLTIRATETNGMLDTYNITIFQCYRSKVNSFNVRYLKHYQLPCDSFDLE